MSIERAAPKRTYTPLLAAIAMTLSTASHAGLSLLQPDALSPATFVGQGGYSTDGLGQLGSGGTIQADVPAGSSVVQAYLYGSHHFTIDPDLAGRTIDFDGTQVVLQKISDVAGFLATTRADVTNQVAAKVGGGGGLTDFFVNNDPTLLSGVALVVIYSNPALPNTTIAVLDGSASPAGDTTTFNFAAPLDKTIPGFLATMSLGIGHSFQGLSGHLCGPNPQYSSVTINGVLLTNCAGNYDDGLLDNGALITVGGVGDTTGNPAPPEAAVDDDELYDLNPFLLQGDNAISIQTANPSQDDNLFVAVMAITAAARVTTEVCDDGIDNDGDGLIDGADPDCVPPPVPEICDDGVDNDLDGLVDMADPDCLAETRRMSGGGTILSGATSVSHGFTLGCDATTVGTPANLQVNWGKNSKFHLESMDAAACTDTAAISEGQPAAGFDTHAGSGTGRYKGSAGAQAEWIITDAGEPGRNDMFSIRITDAQGNVLLDRSGKLKSGNHQAQP